jgi:hypothetical protein
VLSYLPITIHPHQSYREYIPISASPTVPAVDLRQTDVVDKLGRLLDGQTDFAQLDDKPSILANPLRSGAYEPYISSRTIHQSQRLQTDIPFPLPTTANIFPFLDPLDLDILVSYSIPSTSRKGHVLIPSIRPAPEFSIVEGLRAKLEQGTKQGRTMYEETGRLRRVLVDSVLDGSLAREEDPVFVRLTAGVKGKAVLDPSTA